MYRLQNNLVCICRLNTHVKPLIWIESVIERHAHSRVEIMVKAKSQFKRRSTANNVEIMIPVPNDADSPKFKTTIGKLSETSDKFTIIHQPTTHLLYSVLK